MIIMGIDPSLTSLGWGVVKNESGKLKYIASGVVKTPSADAMPKRLAFISAELERVISQFRPMQIAMEETFVNTNATSSLKLGYARGAVMAVIGKSTAEFREFTPNQIKKTVVGVGHAEKEQVLHMIKLLIAGASHVKQFDEADALAAAYTCSVTGL